MGGFVATWRARRVARRWFAYPKHGVKEGEVAVLLQGVVGVGREIRADGRFGHGGVGRSARRGGATSGGARRAERDARGAECQRGAREGRGHKSRTRVGRPRASRVPRTVPVADWRTRDSLRGLGPRSWPFEPSCGCKFRTTTRQRRARPSTHAVVSRSRLLAAWFANAYFARPPTRRSPRRRPTRRPRVESRFAHAQFLAPSSWVTSTAMAELMEAPVEGAVEEWQEGMEAAGPLPLQTLEVRVLALCAHATSDHARHRATRQSRHPPLHISLSRSSPSPSRRSTASRRPTSRNFWRRAFTPSRVSRTPRRRA